MDVDDFEPWKIWRNTVYTWMMCCKYDKKIKTFISRDIAIKIAKMIKVDLKNCKILLCGNKFKLDVVNGGVFLWYASLGRQWSPCYRCLRPMISRPSAPPCAKYICIKCGITAPYYVVGVPVNQIERKLLSKIYDLPNYEWTKVHGYENKTFIEYGEELWLKHNQITIPQ